MKPKGIIIESRTRSEAISRASGSTNSAVSTKRPVSSKHKSQKDQIKPRITPQSTRPPSSCAAAAVVQKPKSLINHGKIQSVDLDLLDKRLFSPVVTAKKQVPISTEKKIPKAENEPKQNTEKKFRSNYLNILNNKHKVEANSSPREIVSPKAKQTAEIRGVMQSCKSVGKLGKAHVSNLSKAITPEMIHLKARIGEIKPRPKSNQGGLFEKPIIKT